MAKKTEDQQGMIFMGFTIVGAGAGLLVSTLTGNWFYMAVCSTIGVGFGFVAMALVGKK